MDMVFVDYTGLHFSGAGGSAELRGKFVQIRTEEREYLVFSPRGLDNYHANIVERFCVERGIKGSYSAAGKRFDIEDPGWMIVGGGKFEIRRTKKSIRLYDDSMAYGKFEMDGLREKVLRIDTFSDYDVSIE